MQQSWTTLKPTVAKSETAPEGASPVRGSPIPAPAIPPRRTPSMLDRLLVPAALALLAVAQVLFAGYRLGVGNQTIQVPFLKQAADPDLYAKDVMVEATVKAYPSYFFKGLAATLGALGVQDVPTAYFVLHVLTAWGVLLAAYALAKAIFRDRLAALVTVLVLFAGHHRALGGDELYSIGFTHTFAVLPVATACLALMYRGWTVAAAVLAGLLFNLHALTAAYLLAMFCAWGLLDRPSKAWKRLPLIVGTFALAALPTALQMVGNKQVFPEEWVRITRIRSSDHSFPSSWWQPGMGDVPRYAMVLALGALALGLRRRDEAQAQAQPAGPSPRWRLARWWATRDASLRMTLLFTSAVLALFALGYVFSEVRPWPTAMRAQPFRSSRLLLVLALVYAAGGIAAGLRSALPWSGVAAWRAPWELAAALAALLCLAIPSFLPFLPWAVALVTLVALLGGRLSWAQAAVAGGAGLVVLMAARQIDYHFAFVGGASGQLEVPDWRAVLLGGWPEVVRRGLSGGPSAPGWSLTVAFWVAAGSAAALGLVLALRDRLATTFKGLALAQGALAAALLVALLWKPLVADALRADPWVDVQAWARERTPETAVFLTPAEASGFRIHSERSVVAEWRDGTQAYFNGAFGNTWWDLINKLQKNLNYNPEGRYRLSAGVPLHARADEELLALARATKATHIVLPLGRDPAPRKLKGLYANGEWAVYAAELDLPMQAASAGAGGADGHDLARFIAEVYVPGLETWEAEAKQTAAWLYDATGALKRKLPLAAPAGQPTEAQIVSAGRAVAARYVVLPATPVGAKERNLKLLHAGSAWSIYAPRFIIPPGEVKAEAWVANEAFLEEVVYPNIEKHRKSDARLELVDAGGAPLPAGTQVRVRQVRQAFGFGASLPFFEATPTAGVREYEYEPPPVDPRELEVFKRVFNYSVIPFSGKWNNIEPEPGKRIYTDLDKYVDWCVKHGVEPEFHYLGGFVPRWAARLSAEEQRSLFLRHALDLTDRYAGKIKRWQLINDARLFAFTPDLIRAIRAAHPDLKLGISDCTGFWKGSSRTTAGLPEVQALREGGTPIDYFAPHGHSPHGCWPAASEVYEVIDTFANEGVRVNVTEVMIPMRQRRGETRIHGPLRGDVWTPELQAEFLEYFYTVCFSHPAVDAVNYWNFGPHSAVEGAGLLDENYQPKPALLALEDLIRRRFRTEFDAKVPEGDSGGGAAAGELTFRGFHGSYEVDVKLPDGRVARGTFEMTPGEENRHRVVVAPLPPPPAPVVAQP